jgi:hypothetical protein
MQAEKSGAVDGGRRPGLPEGEPAGTGQAEFVGAISTPAPEGEFLTSPEEAQAQAKEAADRMAVFRGLPRELTVNEWNSGGTRKLILERMAQLESELVELKKYRSQYHDKDKESAVLRQKLQQATAADKLFDLCLAGGGVLMGLAPSLLDKSHWLLFLVVLLIGCFFTVGPYRLRRHPKAD